MLQIIEHVSEVNTVLLEYSTTRYLLFFDPRL